VTAILPEQATATSYGIDVEVVPTGPAEQRMWTEDTVPARPFVADSEVELGVRFRSEAAGFIDGIRFYEHPSNTGPHLVTLWSAAGAQLATATSPAQAICGWQEARFATPVPILAATDYVASYHTNSGYALQQQYFGSWSPPLLAPEGSNGVYQYGARAFPTSTFAASNYFVDVIFRATATPVEAGPTPVSAYPLP